MRRARHSTLKPVRKNYGHLQYVARLRGLVSDGMKQPILISFKEQAFCLTVRDETEALT